MDTAFAKAWLIKIFTDPAMKKKISAKTLLSVGKKTYGITHAELKEARKEIGLVSKNIDGTQVWYLPEEEHERESD